MTTPSSQSLRIALAHDWLCGLRGGELVLERLAALISADHSPAGLWTMFDSRRPLAPNIDAIPHHASPLARLPFGNSRLRRWLFPAYPAAVASLSRSIARAHRREPLDLLISSSSAAIKGLKAPPGVPHLCYCHAPARYVWSRQDEYSSGLRGLGLRLFAERFREWDAATAANVTHFLANSTHVASQIRAFYDRDADVVFPPVRTDFFTPDQVIPREDFWLIVSALEPYKRVDIAIQAANQAQRPLVIVGGGSQRQHLESLAGPTVRFTGRISDEALRDHYRRAAVLLFPQVEDFGIVAVEAQACGLPILARAEGGALDIVIDGRTGALFADPTPTALIDALARCPRPGTDETTRACRDNALRFAEPVFDAAIRRYLDALRD